MVLVSVHFAIKAMVERNRRHASKRGQVKYFWSSHLSKLRGKPFDRS